MKLVLRLVLAVLITLAGVLPSVSAFARAEHCEHETIVAAPTAAHDDCAGKPADRADHRGDHCIAVAGGCCAPMPVASIVDVPLATIVAVDWHVPSHPVLGGRSFAPATPPPRA